MIIIIMRKKFLDRLILLRKKAGLSAREVSKRICRGESYVARIETGSFTPSLEDVENIAKACGSSLEELFYEGFEDYDIDKDILDKLKKIGRKEKDALLALLVILYHRQVEKGLSDAI